MVRKEYWGKAKELIEWCNEEELKVLTQQANKAIEKRMSVYLGKFEALEDHKARVKKRKAKERYSKPK